MQWLQCIDYSCVRVSQWNWRRNEINGTFYEPINEINHHDMVPNNICHTFVAVGRRSRCIGRIEWVNRTASFTVTYTPNIYCIVFSAWPTTKNILRRSYEKKLDKWTLLCAARVGWTRDEVISAFHFRVRAIRWKTRNWYFFSTRSNNKMRDIECERWACVSFIMGARVVINEF